MKSQLKGRHKRDFANLDARIAHLKEQLDFTQTALLSNSLDEHLHVQESEYIAYLKKFIAIEENAFSGKMKNPLA